MLKTMGNGVKIANKQFSVYLHSSEQSKKIDSNKLRPSITGISVQVFLLKGMFPPTFHLNIFDMKITFDPFKSKRESLYHFTRQNRSRISLLVILISSMSYSFRISPNSRILQTQGRITPLFQVFLCVCRSSGCSTFSQRYISAVP